jgi:hypothetical protein
MLYANAGHAVQTHDQTFACACQAYFFPQAHDDLNVCGCPTPQRLLDRCAPNSLDERCVLKTGDYWSRCICARGQAQGSEGVCRTFTCNAAGTDKTQDADGYMLHDGWWSCRCKQGWHGLSCDKQGQHDCGHGKWIEADQACKCDDFAILSDDNTYCALDCQHNGEYNPENDVCICVNGFTGDLCQYEPVPIPPRPSSSTGIAPWPSSSTGSEPPIPWATHIESVREAAPWITLLAIFAFVLLILVLVCFRSRRSTTESVSTLAHASELKGLL